MKVRTHLLYIWLVSILLWALLSPATYIWWVTYLMLGISWVIGGKIDKAHRKIDELVEDVPQKDPQIPFGEVIMKEQGLITVSDRVRIICPECKDEIPIPILVETFTDGPQYIDARPDVSLVWMHIFAKHADSSYES